MTTISLKINITDLKTTKTLQFFIDKPVADVIREIREKLGEQAGGQDHGLFWPAPNQLKWLFPNRTLEYYDLKTGDTLEFRKKHRPLKVKMLDGAVKTILIDESMPVSSINDQICKRIGIVNSEEYSLAAEPLPVEKHVNSRKKEEKEKEEHRWLNPEKCLPEQQVTEADTLILKKKFFFSDQNVDRNDPIQLNLLFVQAHEGVIDGRHVCSPDEAVQFAAMQMQAQHGSHEPDKHKPGFINLKDFLPPEYRKKDIEKRIYQEHRKLQGMTELNAKYRYVQLCRSLKTYGVTFFKVKEKLAKKSKSTPILLGVTRESVLRIDIETKEILVSWPLTTLRRWAATPTNFTLDFGDYSDSYYMVETTEGEQISQLIAGYIDIILKRKKDVVHVQEDYAEELAITEETVGQVEATSINYVGVKPGKALELNISSSDMLSDNPDTGSVSSSALRHKLQFVNMGKGTLRASLASAKFQNVIKHSPHEAQQALLQNIQVGLSNLNGVALALGKEIALQELDGSSTSWRDKTLMTHLQNISSQLAAHLASTCSVINQTSVDPQQMNYSSFAANISSLTTNLGQLVPSIMLVASLQSSPIHADELLNASRKLAAVTSAFLSSAMPCVTGQGSRQELLSNGQRVGEATALLVNRLGLTDVPLQVQEELVNLAKIVVASIVELVSVAKDLGTKMPDPQSTQELLSWAKLVGQTASQLVTCVSVTAPTADNPLSQDQIDECAVLLKDSMLGLLASSKTASDKPLLIQLNDTITKVESQLANLLSRIRSVGRVEKDDTAAEFSAFYESIMKDTNEMLKSISNPPQVIQLTKQVALATSNLTNVMKARAMEAEEYEKNRLLVSARKLNEGLMKCIAASKEYAKDPQSKANHLGIQKAVSSLQVDIQNAIGFVTKRKVYSMLVNASRNYIRSTNQLVIASKACAQYNRNQESQFVMNQHCKQVDESLVGLILSSKKLLADIENPANQYQLLDHSKSSLIVGSKLIESSKSASMYVGDFATQAQLNLYVDEAQNSTAELVRCIELVEKVTSDLELDYAIENLKSLNTVLEKGSHSELEYGDVNDCMKEMFANSKALSAAVSQFGVSVQQRDIKQMNDCARDLAFAVEQLDGGVGYLALKEQIKDSDGTEASKQLVNDCLQLLVSSKAFLASSEESPTFISDSQISIQNTLNNLTNLIPLRQELNNLMDVMKQTLASVLASPTTFSHISLINDTVSSAQEKLNAAAVEFNHAMSGLLSSLNQQQLDLDKIQAQKETLQTAYQTMIVAAQKYAAFSKDEALKKEMLQSLNEVSLVSVKMMSHAEADKSNLLKNHSQSLSNAMSKILEACSKSFPGQRECSQALSISVTLNDKLLNVNRHSASSGTFFESIQALEVQSKEIAKNLLIIEVENTRDTFTKASGESVLNITNALSAFVDNSVSCLYQLGCSDADSVPADVEIFNKAELSSHANDTYDLCEDIYAASISSMDKTAKLKELFVHLQKLAPHTAYLCSVAKDASQSSKFSETSHSHFSILAKNIAGAVSALVNTIKSSTSDIKLPKETVDHVKGAVRSFMDFVNSNEFEAKQAVISPNTSKIQKPIVDTLRSAIASNAEVVNLTNSLISQLNKTQQHMLFAHSKALQESVTKVFESIKANSPGQKEASLVIETISRSIADLDSAIIQANVNALRTLNQSPYSLLKEQAVDLMFGVLSLTEVIAKNSVTNFKDFIYSIQQLGSSFGPMISGVIAAAAKCEERHTQLDLLNQVKDVSNQLLMFAWNCQKAGGNPKSEGVAQLKEAEVQAQRSLKKAIGILQGKDNQSEELTLIINEIAGLLNQEFEQRSVSDSYSTQAERVKKCETQMTEIIGSTISMININTDDVLNVSGKLKQAYEVMFHSSASIVSNLLSSNDESGANTVGIRTKEIGTFILKLVESLKSIAVKNDFTNKQKLSQCALDLSNAIGLLNEAVKAGQAGLQMIEKASHMLLVILSDIESTMIFASAGQLDSTETESFSKQKNLLIETSVQIVELVKQAVQAKSQEEFGKLVLESTKMMAMLKDQTRSAAIGITSSEKSYQIKLLQIAKDCCESMNAVLDVYVSGRENEVNSYAKVVVNNLSEMIRTIKQIGDEATRVTRAIESMDAEFMELSTSLLSNEAEVGTASPEDLVTLSKALVNHTIQLIGSVAAKKQDEIINSLQKIKSQCAEIVRTGKILVQEQGDRGNIRDILGVMLQNMLELFHKVKEGQDTPNKMQLQACAKNIATTVNQVVESVTSTMELGNQDPNYIAERELLAAANSIELAAKKLVELKQQKRKEQETEKRDLNFEEQIVEAAKSIANATSALIRAATETQREIVSKGKQSSTKVYFSDGTWSEGLVSAAKQVAAATGDLCEAANNSILGSVQPERVIVAARNVSASTTQLLTAASVKTDPNSATIMRLKAAGKSVTNSTMELVKAAQTYNEDEQDEAVQHTSVASQRIAEMEAQMDVLALEKHLVKARERLAGMRKSKYEGNTIRKK